MASRRRGRRRDRLLDEGEDVEGISNPSLVCVLHPPPPTPTPQLCLFEDYFLGVAMDERGVGGGNQIGSGLVR